MAHRHETDTDHSRYFVDTDDDFDLEPRNVLEQSAKPTLPSFSEMLVSITSSIMPSYSKSMSAKNSKGSLRSGLMALILAGFFSSFNEVTRKLSKNDGLSLLSLCWIFFDTYFCIRVAYLEKSVRAPFLEECHQQLVQGIQLEVLRTTIQRQNTGNGMLLLGRSDRRSIVGIRRDVHFRFFARGSVLLLRT